MLKFPKTLYFAISGLTAIHKNGQLILRRSGQLQHSKLYSFQTQNAECISYYFCYSVDYFINRIEFMQIGVIIVYLAIIL